MIPINNYTSKSENDRALYLSDQWNQGIVVLLSGDSIVQYPIKYNLSTKNVEVKTKQAIKVVPLKDMRSFYWFDDGNRYDFINGSGYTTEALPYTGYFQVLIEGTVNLFKKTHLSVQKANYRPELDVGSPNDRVVKTEAYYLAQRRSVIELKRSKNVYGFFKQHRDEVKRYARKQKWNPKREEDLVAIVGYYNELVR